MTLTDGSLVSINYMAIAYFHAADSHTLIYLSSGQHITVRESYDAVAELFNPEQEAEG